MRSISRTLTPLAAVTALAIPLLAVGPSFKPDAVVKGSSLAGWHTLGQAEWKIQNGEITGTAKSSKGGWLVLDRSLQDAGINTQFRCGEGCKTGILFRAEKTLQGMKGIYVSLTAGDVAPYRVTLDAEGQELTRERLRFIGGQLRIAPPADPNAPGRGGGRGRGPLPANPALPIQRPVTDLRPTDWNQVEILLDVNIIRTFLNNGGEIAGVTDDAPNSYGPLALYVGGTGEVKYKDVAWKDLGEKETVREQVSPNFRMQRLNPFYYAWGAAAVDVNHDGTLDVVAGPYYYLGPDFTRRREIYPAEMRNPAREFTVDCWMTYAADFTGDGWPDVITSSFSPDGGPGGEVGVWLYVNPKGESRRWDKYQVVKAVQSEVATLRDVDGDGKPEIVYMGEGFVRYAHPDPSNPTGLWTIRTVSEVGFGTAHGIGVGDINGDGRMDITNAWGWWEQPASKSDNGPWKYHSQAFGRYGRNIIGGSIMAIYDVNGDGLNDVVTVLQPHGYGLAWFEQKRDASKNITFVQHMIMDDSATKNAGGVTFSQPHGTAFGDMNGDGITDFVVGKRFWSHKDDYLDPDPYGPAVLYVYKTVRNPKAPGGAEFVPELVHNQSGAGSDLLTVDLNKDGALDIVTATKLGTFVFWGKPKLKAAAAPKP